MPRFALALSFLFVATAHAQIPLSFAENRGQAPMDVLFTAGPVAVKPSEIVVSNARIRFAHAARPRVRGVEPLPGHANAFIGTDPSRWRTNIPTFGAVEYAQLWRGIDLRLHGGSNSLEYDFVVAPGADPPTIGIRFDRDLRLDGNGDLLAGALRNARPLAYQEIDGKHVPVAAAWRIGKQREARFRLGAYDASKPLIIDPVLSYSSYFGGTADEEENAVAVDNDGNVYFAGSTKSTDIAVTAGAAQTTFGGKGSFGGDVYVVKYDPKTNKVVYATYLGGSADDNALGIAVDAGGNAYITGQTDSHNFPLKNAFQPTFGGLTYEAFITKLSPAGDALVYSSYLGGTSNEQGNAVAVDGAGNAYIAGWTFSTNFPTTNGFQTSFGGRIFDGFLTKINAAGSAVVYSTFLGGTTYDVANAVAVDGSNNAYVAGYTFSANFPTKAAYQSTITSGTCGSGSNSSNCADAFVAKIDTSQSGNASLIYSTFLGGSKNDYANAIGITAAGEAVVAGVTDSTNFPAVNAAQPTSGGSYDAFITKLNAAGSGLVYSTYLGGSGYDEAAALRVDTSGRAVVFGTAASANFPTKAAFQGTFGGGAGNALIVRQVAAPVGGTTFALITLSSDAFAAKFDAGGAESYASFLGGAGDEIGYGAAIDAAGNTWVTGSTTSTNLTTINAVQSGLKGGIDLFFARIAGFGVTSVAPSFGPTAGGTHVTLAGEGFQTGATVTFGGTNATGVSVASTSIGATAPAHAAGAVDVVVRNPDGDTATLAAGYFYTDAPLPSLSLSPASQQIEVGWNGPVTVTLSNAQPIDVAVTLSAPSPSVLKIPGSVTVPAGATTATFNATGVSAGGPITITAKLPQILGGQSATATATVIAAKYAPKLSAPGQARLAGAGGSFFKTTFWMVNPNTTETKVRLKFVTANTGGGTNAKELTLAPNESVAYGDVLSEAFGATSDTSGVIIVETAPGSPTPLAAARTFNDLGANGTYGQYIPAVPLPTGSGGIFLQSLYGLGGDVSNRSNVGIVNLGTSDLDATISVLSPTGAHLGNDVPVHVPAQGAAQVNGVNLAAGAGSLSTFDVQIYSTAQYTGYASKLDNKTSDPIYIPSTLAAQTSQYIDGVGAVAGANNTFFRSDLLLHNAHVSASTTASVQFIRWGESTPFKSATVPLNAGESKLFHDVLNDLFSLSSGVGSLLITSSVPVVAWARTYNDLGANGTYGQFIPAFGTSDLIGQKGAILLGLSDNAAFRTNAGFVNRSSIGVEIAVSAWQGTNKLAEKNYLVPANTTLNAGRIFLDLGLSNVSNVYLKIVPAAFPSIYAWASSIDNRSSDQTYVRPMAVP